MKILISVDNIKKLQKITKVINELLMGHDTTLKLLQKMQSILLLCI